MLRSVFKERWECTHSFVRHCILQCKRRTALAQARSFNRPQHLCTPLTPSSLPTPLTLTGHFLAGYEQPDGFLDSFR
jgi:hypothetical protein